MKFTVSKKLFEQYPDLIEAVVVLKDIDNTVDGSDILKLLRTEERVKQNALEKGKLGDHPKIKPWRDAFQSFGSKPSKFPSSVEALLKRVLQGQKLPDVNPLVNLYNYCSIKHILPFGGEDFEGVYGDMELRHCDGTEEYYAIFSDENEPPDKGEIAWVDDRGVTCRKWNWRQCDRTKITEETTEGYFIIDRLPTVGKQEQGNGELLKTEIENAAKEFIELAEKHLGAKGEVHWITKETPEVEIDVKTRVLEQEAKGQPAVGYQLSAKATQEASSKQAVANKNVSEKQAELDQSSKKKSHGRKTSTDFINVVDNTLPLYQIRRGVYAAVEKAGFAEGLQEEDINIEHPQDEKFGDYSTNIAMILAGRLQKNPKEIAEKIKIHIDMGDLVEDISVVGGFINFILKSEWLVKQVREIVTKAEDYGTFDENGVRLIIEYGQPNTHKMPHIGHLFSYVLGGSLVNIAKALGYTVFRANYQGDVGPQVAKCMWAYMKEKPEIPDTPKERAELLQLMYQTGSAAYESDPVAKDEIDELNKKIYRKDPAVIDLWTKTRSWSLEFYAEFEKLLGVGYERAFFESETAEEGKKIVEENIGNVFTKSDGAVIFEGSKYGLHDRVFITKKGTPTYEGKDMALQPMKYKVWPFDKMIIMTAHEQHEYFKVVFKALEVLDPKWRDKLMHIGFGMVNLKGGKISSRKGNIITGIELIDQGIAAIREIVEDRDKLTTDQKEDIAKVVGVGAIKYSFLKTDPLQDMTFDFEESVSFEGNSGPYLQYTYARAKSILREATFETQSSKLETGYNFNAEELSLLRTLYKFPEVVLNAGNALAPNLMCNYLFDLAQKFNSFYKKHSVLQADSEEQTQMRLAITAATAQVLKNGLHLLGIEVLEKM